MTLIFSQQCPHCGEKKFYQSRRRGLLETVLLRAIFIAPIRCGECSRRFLRPAFIPARERKSRGSTRDE